MADGPPFYGYIIPALFLHSSCNWQPVLRTLTVLSVLSVLSVVEGSKDRRVEGRSIPVFLPVFQKRELSVPTWFCNLLFVSLLLFGILIEYLTVTRQLVKQRKQNPLTPNCKCMMAVNVITTRPNPFISSLTLEISASEDQPGVVRMADATGKIISLFLWKLKKGINISNINNLNKLDTGMYMLDVMDEEGKIMCSAKVIK